MALSTTISPHAQIYEYPAVLGVAASTSIVANDLVSFDADGFVIKAADTANTFFLGRALDDADNSSGADGDIKVRVCWGFLRCSMASAAAANNGSLLYANGSNTVALAATTTNDVPVGVQIANYGTTEVLVAVPMGGSGALNA